MRTIKEFTVSKVRIIDLIMCRATLLIDFFGPYSERETQRTLLIVFKIPCVL